MALGADPWVVSTMTHGYRIQFLHQPPVTRTPTFTTVGNPQQRVVLQAELSTLLEKEAIREGPSGDNPLTLERQQAFRTCLTLFQLHALVNWGLCFHLMGLMAAMVQVVPLALLHMRPVQRCLLGLGLCLQRSHKTKSGDLSEASQGPPVVEGPSKHQAGPNPGSSDLSPTDVHRHILFGVGRHTRSPWCQQCLDRPVAVSAHKCTRAEGGSPRSASFPAKTKGSPHHCPHRQHSDGRLHQQTGGPQLLCPVQARDHPVAVGSPTPPLAQSCAHAGALNSVADTMSRGGPQSGEWRLHPQVVSTPFFPSLFSSLFSEEFWWSVCGSYWWLLCGPTCCGSQRFHPYWTDCLGSSRTRGTCSTRRTEPCSTPFQKGFRLVAWPLRGTGSWP